MINEEGENDYMKIFLIKYYTSIILLFFIMYNFVLSCLKISGPLYEAFIVIVIFVNNFILIQFRKNIKYKGTLCLIFFFMWFFSKDFLQCFLAFFIIGILCITGFTENRHMKVITICILTFTTLFFIPITLIFLIRFHLDANHVIYEDTHYLCEENYEIYSFSQGAMDGFHYSIGKYYEVLHIDGMIDITYRKRKETSKEKYEKYIKNHICHLVGEKNGLTENF